MRMLPMGKCCQFQFPMIHWKLALVIGNIFTLATFFGATAAETPWIDERYETAGETGAWTALSPESQTLWYEISID